jgi:magnesium-transporting ATPase (P-type)
MNKETLEKCMSLINEKNADPSNKVISKMSGSHELPSPIIMSGTSIANGEG